MPSKSPEQQRLFGMVTKYLHEKSAGRSQEYLEEITDKYGKSLADKIKSIADGQRKKTGDKRKFTKGVDLETARDFARTKHADMVQVEMALNFNDFVNSLNENKGKSIDSITEEDLLYVLQDDIPTGWEVFKYHLDKGWKGIKIRKKYGKGEIHFNEDGYEYKTVFLAPNKTTHYKKLIEKGYDA